MNVEQIVDPIFQPRDSKCCHVRNLFVSMRALTFYFRNGMSIATCSANCNLTCTSMEDAVVEQSVGKDVKKGFKILSLDSVTVVAIRAS